MKTLRLFSPDCNLWFVSALSQVGGVLLVVAGVGLAAWPGKGGGSVLANVSEMRGWHMCCPGLKTRGERLGFL